MTEFDAEEIRRLEEAGAAKRVKREWIEKGYTHQMSLYGAVENIDNGEVRGTRIEILCNVEYTPHIIQILYQFFYRYHPLARYSIWIFTNETESLKQVGDYP